MQKKYLFPAKHKISRSLQTVDDRLPARVEVVELGLDDTVVHVHGGDGQFRWLAELVETMDTCYTFLYYTLQNTF